jgi:hypothetical protein
MSLVKTMSLVKLRRGVRGWRGAIALAVLNVVAKVRLAMLRWRMRRDAARTLAHALHASNAWHCGCGACVVARGDVRRKVLPGPWPVRVECWLPSEEEWRRYRGDA